MKLRMYKVLLFKSRRDLCKGSIVALVHAVSLPVCYLGKKGDVRQFTFALRSFPSIALRISTAHNFTRD